MTDQKNKYKEEFIKRLVRFSVDVLNFSEKLKEKKLWSIADQLIRSTTSIGANVVEAKSASSKREYIHYFQIALKSANETKYWLLVVSEYCTDLSSKVEKYQKEADELSRIIGASILTLKGRK